LEKGDDIPNSFATCLGGLLSVFAQNISIKIKFINECKLIKNYSKFKFNIEGDTITVGLNYLLSEEKRDLLFNIKLPKIEKEDKEFEICEIELNYFNVSEMNQEKINFTSKITRLISPSLILSFTNVPLSPEPQGPLPPQRELSAE